MTEPTVHVVADALHILADLVAAGKYNGREFEADSYQAEVIKAAMTWSWDHADGCHTEGLILDWRVTVKPVPSTVLADAFDQEAG